MTVAVLPGIFIAISIPLKVTGIQWVFNNACRVNDNDKSPVNTVTHASFPKLFHLFHGYSHIYSLIILNYPGTNDLVCGWLRSLPASPS